MKSAAAIVVLLAAHAAVAQPAPVDEAYAEGRRLYDLREWDAAIAKFKESYKAHESPKSLFNIAQAYRLAGRCTDATDYYKTYRRNYPSADNLAVVEKFIADLAPCVQAEADTRAASPPPPTPAPAPVQPVQPVPPPAPPPAAHTPVTAIALLSGGGIALGAGAVFAVLAHGRASAAESGTGPWDPSIESAGNRDALVGKILIGVGAAAAIGGAIVLVTGRAHGAEHLAVAPTVGGVTMGWACGF